MPRYLVTGGCGFIGSHLVSALLDDGHEVVVLDDLSTGRRNNLDGRALFLAGDAGDAALVARAMHAADGCYHLAAVASVQRSREDWIGTHRINQTATLVVLDAARTARDSLPIPVVYASSAAVYGNAPTMPVSERTPVAPLTAYGADKLGCELHAAVAWQQFAVPTTGLRFFNVYGPRQDPHSPYSGVVSISRTDCREVCH